MSLLGLSMILGTSQEPTKKQLRKQKEQQEHNVVFDTTVVSSRAIDSLFLEQKNLNMKLDSLLNEKSKK